VEGHPTIASVEKMNITFTWRKLELSGLVALSQAFEFTARSVIRDCPNSDTKTRLTGKSHLGSMGANTWLTMH
jgi:hypothetical protein